MSKFINNVKDKLKEWIWRLIFSRHYPPPPL
jgi:hypothetical protein